MRLVLIAPILLLAACSEPELSEAERAARVAEIERVNEGVALPFEPERILYPDIEANDLYGASCAFAPEGGGMAPVLLAMEEAAHMKLRGEMVTFAPDKGTQKGPSLAWTKYDGREHSLNLGLGTETGEGGTIGSTRYEARLTVRDPKDRIVYEAAGHAQCGA